MTNCYYKMLSNKINAGCKDEFISGLQSELRQSITSENEDLYSMITNLSSANGSKLDINLLLKYYMLNQIIEGNNNKDNKASYKDTKNPNIKVDKNGTYYRITENDVIKEERIQTVYEDGSYVVNEKRHTDAFKILKTYNINDQILSIKVVDAMGKPNSNKIVAAELIGLRKEFKKKYKHSGYSGNSKDMVATLRNMFSTPIETGYYIDFHCAFYRWQYSISSFVRVFERESDSPLLVDMEFRDNGTVLRQEYTGIVA